MNKNNRTELILSLAKVAGHARRVLSDNIQRQLFKFGYRWSPTHWDGKPDHLDAGVLHINSPLWNLTHITYARDEPVSVDGPACIFDASTHAAEFLEAAKNALVAERVIEGVKVTIRPDAVNMDVVNMDATDSLTRVGAEARRMQLELFGQ